MPTTIEFDTFYHDQWSGEIAVTVLDKDSTPNRVLDITLPWEIKVHWSVSTEDPGDAPVNLITQGHWRVEAFAESIGTAAGGLEDSLVPFVNVPYSPPLPGGSAAEYAWETTLMVPAGKINLPGVYKITVMIQYHTAPNVFTQMVGFAEHPAICFNRLP